MASRANRPRRSRPALEAALEIVRAWGSKGGKIGGKARWDGVSAEERSRILSRAAKARWVKKKRQKPT